MFKKLCFSKAVQDEERKEATQLGGHGGAGVQLALVLLAVLFPHGVGNTLNRLESKELQPEDNARSLKPGMRMAGGLVE